MSRVVVLALSEASPELVTSFCERGTMPHTETLRRNGLWGRTRYSTPYLLTPQMWATILTGRGAGSHGIFDYWQRGGDGSFFETRGSDIKGPRIWDELAKNCIPCGFVNVPMTYPPPEVPGFALSGQDAPGAHASIAFPRRLYADLTKHFGRYHHKDIFPGGQDKDAYASLLLEELRRQEDLFEWLVRRDDWRFLMLYTSATAFAQHYFWGDIGSHSADGAIVEKTYAAADALIGRVMKLLKPDDTIFIMSECGAGPIEGGVNLNLWLHQEGFLARHRRGNTPSQKARALTAFRVASQRYLPKNVFHLANSLPLKKWIQGAIASDGIDWRRTAAYHRGKGEGNIYINLMGRDSQGSVPPAQYERVRAELADRLIDLRDPKTGARAVAAVHRREDLFAGHHLGSAPDLVVEWDGFRYMPSEDLTGGTNVFGVRTREYMKWPTTGSHRPEGLLVASGPSVQSGSIDSPIELRDLAPTWLSLMRCSVPVAMEGVPASAILNTKL